jgi:hypothetical protein
MKKTALSIVLLISALCANAQLINSFGINAGVTMAKHLWKVNQSNDINGNPMPEPYYYNDPQQWKFGFNAGVFLEMFQNEHIRWQTELQFNQKGGIDVDTYNKKAKHLTNTDHICWNNYAKIRYEIYSGVPYILLGVRLEYVLSQATSSPPVARGPFNKFQITPAAGIGWEFITYGSIKPFVELIYNPSPTFGPPSYHVEDLTLYNRALELRVGIRIELARKETCPRVYK